MDGKEEHRPERKADAGQLVPAAPLAPWQGATTVFSTFGNADIAAKAKTLKVINGDALNADECRNQVLKVEHLVMHEVPMEDETTGELVNKLRTVIVCADGTCVACVSDGVVNSLRQISSLYGPAPWPGGLDCELIERRTRKGFKVLKLIPIGA